LGVVPVRSPLLGESRLIPLPPGTEMFQFPGFASPRRVMTGLTTRRVAPFGHPGITACVPLPLAYRSLPRPSSPPCAQASPTCLRSLDYITVMKQSTRYLLQRVISISARTKQLSRGTSPAADGKNCHHDVDPIGTGDLAIDRTYPTIWPVALQCKAAGSTSTFRCQTASRQRPPREGAAREKLQSRREKTGCVEAGDFR
jgi:hypothetical protein